jgi:Phage protein
MASQIEKHFRELCYGIPIALIAEWCCVSSSVASKYKSGARIPSPAACELFKLKLEGRIVPDEWSGFCFRRGALFGPDGKAFTHGHLRAYELGMQLLRAFSRDDPGRTDRVDSIFSAAAVNAPAIALTSRSKTGSKLKAAVHTHARITGPIVRAPCAVRFRDGNRGSGADPRRMPRR